jgi:large subunit ribosomal protein L4
MAVVDVKNTVGEKVSEIDLPDSIFNVEVKGCVLHDVVKAQLAARRAGTHAVKNRSDVRGSTRKLFRQKGTGNARAGSIKSPLRRGGGVIFGPTPRSYALKVPKKVRKLALKMALASKFQAETLTVLDTFEMAEIKTKAFVETVAKLGTQNALIVVDGQNENLELSARNVPGVKVLRAEGLNVYDVLKYENLLLVEASVKSIEGRLL